MVKGIDWQEEKSQVCRKRLGSKAEENVYKIYNILHMLYVLYKVNHFVTLDFNTR